jgi:hypothetical protein
MSTAIEIHTGLHAYPALKANSDSKAGHQILTVLFGADKAPKSEDKFFIHKTNFVQVKEPKPVDAEPGVYKLFVIEQSKYEKQQKPENKYYRTYFNPLDGGKYEFLECLNAKPVDLKDGRDYFYFKEGKSVIITDAKSGSKVAEGQSLKIAMFNAADAMKGKDMEALSKGFIEKYGLSPRYLPTPIN